MRSALDLFHGILEAMLRFILLTAVIAVTACGARSTPSPPPEPAPGPAVDAGVR